jgi:hypothetical protein
MRVVLIHSKLTKFSKFTNLTMIILFVFLIINVFTWDYAKGNNNIAMIILIIYLGIFFIKLIRSFEKKDFEITGEMFLESEGIIVKEGENKISCGYTEMEELLITFSGFEGESYPYSFSFSLNTFQQKQGNKNFIEFKINDTINKHEFFLENKAQSLILFTHLRQMEEKGFAFKFKNLFGNNKIYENV